GGLGYTGRHVLDVATTRHHHDLKHRDHAGHCTQQTNQGGKGNHGLDQRHGLVDLLADAGDQGVPNLVGTLGLAFRAGLPGVQCLVHVLAQCNLVVPDPFEDKCPHDKYQNRDGVEDHATLVHKVTDAFPSIEQCVHGLTLYVLRDDSGALLFKDVQNALG